MRSVSVSRERVIRDLSLLRTRRQSIWRAALRGAFIAMLAFGAMHFAAATTIVVDDSGDDATCAGFYNLRCAINYANANPSTSIRFAPGLPAVLLLGSLPTITGDGTWIDGHDINGGCACPRIDGAFWTGPSGNAMTINASYVTISNLRFVRIPPAISNADVAIMGGKDIAIAFDYLGLLPGATQCAVSDAGAGVSITGDGSGASGADNGAAYIYGSTIGCHNLAGVYALQSGYVTVGTDRAGNSFGDLIGIADDGVHAAGNGIGVYADHQADNMTIRNNRIGYSSLYGVYSSTAASTSLLYNEISNNASVGVNFLYGNSHLVIGNKIGTTSDGLASAPNGSIGVAFSDVGTGTVVTDNLVAYNRGAGMEVQGQSHVAIENNDIYANASIPIDLGNDGFSPNGLHFPPGPNDWLPYPVITNGSTNLITGTACVNCIVYIFKAIGDPSRPGGGGKFVTNVFASSSGAWVATLPTGMTRDDVALTAGSSGGTSEMSPRDVIFRNGFE